MENNKSIGIKDIARLSGVSTGTVDRVLHKRGKVSPEAAQKVLSTLERINYRPNFLARNLGSNKVQRIAVLIPNSNTDEYWYQCKQGIDRAAKEWEHFNIELNYFLFDLNNRESFNYAAEQVIEASPNGVLIAPLFYSEALSCFSRLKNQNIQYVLFNTDIKDAQPLSFIGQNSFHSGRLAAELLHMHMSPAESSTFAIVHIEEDLPNSVHLVEKENGFREYVKEITSHEIKPITYTLGSPADHDFRSQLDRLFAVPDLKGIFVSTSKAFEVASFMTTYKKKHVRIVGYDLLSKNLFYLKRGMIDFLIHQNPKRQAFQGVSTLANYLIFNKDIKPRNLFPLDVITRENLSSHLNSDTY
jgi:LacI family transcriptional regulator